MDTPYTCDDWIIGVRKGAVSGALAVHMTYSRILVSLEKMYLMI